MTNKITTRLKDLVAKRKHNEDIMVWATREGNPIPGEVLTELEAIRLRKDELEKLLLTEKKE